MMVGFLRLLSRLPYGALHGVAGFAAFVLGQILGYRKTVVLNNLRRSFPDADETTLRKWHRQFMRHFADISVESIKHFTEMLDGFDGNVRCFNPFLNLDAVFSSLAAT